MANEKFSIQEALRYGWATYKANLGFFLGFIIVIMVLATLPQYLVSAIFGRTLVAKFFAFLLRIFGLFLGMVATRVSLDIHDGGRADLSKIGALVPLLLWYVLAKIFYGVAVMIGLVLLIIPGFILAYMFLYHGYLIIDKGLGPIEALAQSRVITDGAKWDLFLFSIVVGLLNLLGMACLVIGLIVTLPITLMASVYVYRRLSPAAQTAAA